MPAEKKYTKRVPAPLPSKIREVDIVWEAPEITPKAASFIQELVDEVKSGHTVGLERILKLKKDLGV